MGAAARSHFNDHLPLINLNFAGPRLGGRCAKTGHIDWHRPCSPLRPKPRVSQTTKILVHGMRKIRETECQPNKNRLAELKGSRYCVNLEMSFTVDFASGCCARPFGFYRFCNLPRGSRRGLGHRRLHRFVGHAQLRRAVGTDWRSLCQASPRACQRHGTRSLNGSRTPVGAALSPADRARSLWRSQISLRSAGMRVRRLLGSALVSVPRSPLLPPPEIAKRSSGSRV